MKKPVILILFLFAFVVSCAASHERSEFSTYNAACWYKATSTYEQTQRDYQECKMYGMAHATMNPFMAITLTHECMKTKGYRPR